MGKWIRFSDTVRKIVAPQLRQYGYEQIIPPGYKGSGIILFSKNVFDDLNGFIEFDRSQWVAPEANDSEMVRRFWVLLFRNKGNEPDRIQEQRGDKYFSVISLSYLLWDVYHVHKYEWRHYSWDYTSLKELKTQLETVMEDLVQYGIPWLEDPKSKSPFL